MIPSHRSPTHAGEMLLEEFLLPIKMTQVEAARRMGIPLNRLNEIIRGRRGVTADTAIRLARLLGTSAEFWMNLQSAWDIYDAAQRMHFNLDSIAVVPSSFEEPTLREVQVHLKGWSGGVTLEQMFTKKEEITEGVEVCDSSLEMVA